MSKTRRLIELMLKINNRKKYTVGELAEEFGVSYRTMLRDLQTLSELGVPLYSELGVHGGYTSLAQRTLPPIIFTEEEAVAVYFIIQSLEYYGSIPFHDKTKSAINKFYNYLPEEVKKQVDNMKERLVFWNPSRNQSSNFLQVLLDASITRRKVSIHYDSKSRQKERVILPIGLYTYNGYWYCPAFCYGTQSYRLFRGDRLLGATLTPETESAVDFDEKTVLDWLKPLLNEHCHPFRLVVKFDKEGLRRVQSDLSLGHLIQIPHEDGSGVIDTTIPESKLDYFADLIYSIGEHAIVEQPPEIIDRIKEKINRHLNLYKK